MSYENDAAAVCELMLYVNNTYSLYVQQNCIEVNLARKVAKGTYDASKAPKLWQYLTDEASREYKKEFGGGFTVAVRKQAAADYAAWFDNCVSHGGMDLCSEAASLIEGAYSPMISAGWFVKGMLEGSK